MSVTTNSVESIPNDDVLVYEVPATKELARVDLNIVNTSPSNSPEVSVFISEANSPTTKDIIESSITISDVYTRSCILMKPGEKLIVRASTTGVVSRTAALEKEVEA